MFVNDPCEARTGDWSVKLLGGIWGSSAGRGGGGIECLTPMQGVYFVGGFAKDLRPGGEDSPRLPDSEVIYYDANGDRVGDNQLGDPWRHHLFYTFEGPLGSTPPTGNPGSFDFPRDGEYHLFYARTRFPSEMPPEVAYLAAGAWSHPDCDYAFDDMMAIEADMHPVDHPRTCR